MPQGRWDPDASSNRLVVAWFCLIPLLLLRNRFKSMSSILKKKEPILPLMSIQAHVSRLFDAYEEECASPELPQRTLRSVVDDVIIASLKHADGLHDIR